MDLNFIDPLVLDVHVLVDELVHLSSCDWFLQLYTDDACNLLRREYDLAFSEALVNYRENALL